MEDLLKNEAFNSHYTRMFNYNSDEVYKRINFAEKFKIFENNFSLDTNHEYRIDNRQVIEVSKSMGYDLKYSRTTSFYGEQIVNNLICMPAFDTKYNVFELGSAFKTKQGSLLISGGTWSNLIFMLTAGKVKFLNPKCFSENHLEFILRNYFIIFEELKVEMLHYYNDFKL